MSVAVGLLAFGGLWPLVEAVGLGVAAAVAPFAVRPRATLRAVAAIATVLAIGLSLDGRLSRVDGAILLAAFAPLAAAVFLRRRGPAPPAGSASTNSACQRPSSACSPAPCSHAADSAAPKAPC